MIMETVHVIILQVVHNMQVQPFVGSNYFCESGNPDSSISLKLYTSDPLWDGQGCGAQEGICCSVPGLPWFHRM